MNNAIAKLNLSLYEMNCDQINKLGILYEKLPWAGIIRLRCDYFLPLCTTLLILHEHIIDINVKTIKAALEFTDA